MDYPEIKEKLHSHILRLRGKQQLTGRYRLREYQAIIKSEPEGGNTNYPTYLCQIENIDTKILESIIVKQEEII